jgi:hypothetical protein
VSIEVDEEIVIEPDEETGSQERSNEANEVERRRTGIVDGLESPAGAPGSLLISPFTFVSFVASFLRSDLFGFLTPHGRLRP